MSRKLKPTNKGPMDRFLKPCHNTPASSGCASSPAPSQQESPRCRPRNKENEELHVTHSFEWCGSDKKPMTLTCNKAGTIENVLKRSHQFKEIAEKNKNKELVIVRDGKAISSHFPCSLIKNERLNIKHVKAENRPKQPVSKVLSGELVTFHVLTKGGRKVVNIMANPTFKKDFHEISVYARKGETVKQALRRDGRLLKAVFQKNCVLSHRSTEVTTEMSNLVDDLDGETFRIKLLNRSCPPESQPGSLDDVYVEGESACNGNDDLTEPVDDNKEPSLFCKIPNSKDMHGKLTSRFINSMKLMKVSQGSKLTPTQNRLRSEFGKRAQACNEVQTMKKLMSLSDSVCQLRINGRPCGSGFLLFGRFVLTNAHVFQDFYNENSGSLNETLTVHFSFESLDRLDTGLLVEEVVGFERFDEFGHKYDWALLRLDGDQALPHVLLKCFGFLPQSGGICIIGHPDGGVKRIDACMVIPTKNLDQVVERHRAENPEGVRPYNLYESHEPIHLLTSRFFEDMRKDKTLSQVLPYETCFYFGSSGSPVFDEHCNVVAMHSAGHPYENARGEMKSVLEFGYPLSTIINRIIVQLVGKGRYDVLSEYLACDYRHQQNMMVILKEMVESRNLSVFKNTADDSLHIRDEESLKTFFGFFCQREETVSMETD